ncbi:hypothetical protein PMZ80_005155 [Knufia obscura]|uniref:Uncharacterized protein n=1 Tax=Knufia obscura TaxID=1635080 RepID=A0ABR0RQR0_9EURO|nr:hypothetical protein PMZ80_005155 [Knufia obscura]
MQRFMQSWTGPPPRQQVQQHRTLSPQGGYVNMTGQTGYPVEAHRQAQIQAQQMALKTMTRGQTGARKSPHLTNQNMPQTMSQMPQMPPQQFPTGHRMNVLTGATTLSPQLDVQNLADAGSGMDVDSDTIVVDTPAHPRTPYVNGNNYQAHAQQIPNLAPIDVQAQHTSPSRMTRSHTTASLPQQDPQINAQPQPHPQLTTEPTAQHDSKGPIIGHGPNGPIHLHGPVSSPRRRQSQFSVHEDAATGPDGGREVQSPVSARKSRRGRPTRVDVERQVRMGLGRGVDGEGLFLPR